MCEGVCGVMAGGHAKRVARENGSRLALLRKAITGSQVAHVVGAVVVARSVSPAIIHGRKAWTFLLVINAFAWFAYNFLSNLAASGTSLTPATVGGSKAQGVGCPWWIENLQDLIFLIVGTNTFSIFSMKMGVGMLTLIPLYCAYLIGSSVVKYVFTPSKVEEEPRPDADAPKKKGGKKRQTVSKNRTR